MNFQSDQPNKPDRRDRPNEQAFVEHAQWETILARLQGKRSKSDGRSMRTMETTPAASLDATKEQGIDRPMAQ